ncbi:gliding motility-associated C-terminal domain-containing protein [Rufibacter radiotolerans]|uniref:gliding motility-associated C-terminal domain-containing protein n=1 Tax=Rufibacter radiotolerans TaxID=1379910 RepID=UPI0006647CE6|nr:T9SS C-terminal target domain-containing protein [Rufibacter radiotolerans]
MKKFFSFFTLLFFWSLYTFAQTCPDKPDASLSDANEENFTRCSSVGGSVEYNLEVVNASTTSSKNKEAIIEWGDGTSNTYPASFTTASHTYKTQGSFNLKYTVVSQNGCTASSTYPVFNGSTPGIGIQSPNNTSDCAPAAFKFGILGTEGNAATTKYAIWFDDGTDTLHYTQSNLPSTIVHNFTKSSEGKPKGFTMFAIAYGCISKQAEVSGIVISSKPIASFSIQPGNTLCPNQTITLNDDTKSGYNGNNVGGNTSGYKRLWTISPSTGWAFTNGTNASSAKPSILFQNKGTYTIQLAVTPSGTSTTCTGDSTNQSIVVRDAPSAPAAAGAAICAGTTATLKATGEGSVFNWFASAGATTPLATGATFTTPVLTTTTTYYVESARSGGCTSQTRTPVQVTVTPLPSAPTAADMTTCFGSPATLKASATGGTVYWYATATGDEKDFLATGPTFITPALNATTTYYTATLSPEGCFSASRNAVKVTVQPTLTGNSISTDQTFCLGEAAASLTGEALSGGSGTYAYQWESSTNGTVFTKAPGTSTAADYAPGTLTQSTWFRRVVTSGSCTSVSEPVKISVVPGISNNTVQGPADNICYGTTTTISGSLPGGGNGGQPVYAWEASTTSDTQGFSLVTGSSNVSSYQTGPITANTWFRRKVTIDGCTQTSPAVLVSVYAISFPPTVANVTICSGSSATLTATAPGGPYEWFTSATGGSPVFTGDTFVTPALFVNATYFVQSKAPGNCAKIRTEVTVTVQPPIANNFTSEAQVVCEGSVPAVITGYRPTGGNGVPQYSWESSLDGNRFSAAVGTNTNQNYAPAALTQTTWFRRKVTMGACVDFTAPVKMEMTPALKPVTMPADILVCDESTAPVINAPAATGGNGTYTYKWEKSITSATAGFTTASGAFENATYAPGILPATTWFRRVTYSGDCQLTSSAVKITVLPLPSPPIARSVAICQGGTATLTATASSTTYKVQWFDAPTGGNLLAEGNTFTTATLQNNVSYYAQAVTTNGCVSPGRAEVKVTVTALPSAPEGIAATVCHSEKAILEVKNPANDLSYAWFAAPSGGTALFSGPAFTTPALTQTTTFYVQAVAGGCAGPRTAVQVTVQPPVANNVLSGVQEICAGTNAGTITGALPTGGTNSYTYQWQSSTDGIAYYAAAGANQEQDYTPGILYQTTWYRRVVKSGTCLAQTSAAVKVTVSSSIINNFIQDNQVIFINNKPAAFTGTTPTGGAGNYQYQWESSLDGVSYSTISGATGKTFASGAISQTTWFRRKVTSGGCDVLSNEVKVTVNAGLSQNTITEDQSICTGNAPKLLVGSEPVGGDGTFHYVWEMSTTGATSDFVTASGNPATRDYMSGPLTQTTWFRRKVSSGTITLESNVIKVTVFTAITQNSISTNQTVCLNTAPARLTGTTPEGGNGSFTYVWESSTSGPASGFGTAFGNTTEQHYAPGPLTRTTWFRRKVLSGGCAIAESNVVQVTVTVPQPPTVKEAFICAGFSATLQAIPNGTVPTVIEWFDKPMGGKLLGSGQQFTTPVLKETTTYYVRSVVQNCASEMVAVKANIPAPTANAGPDVTIITRRFVELEAKGGISYAWSPSLGLSDDKIANPVAKPTVTTTYTVTVTTPDGCTSSDQVTITVLPPVEVPNGFTPNGDRINDAWDLPGLNNYPNSQVEIFNRWGNKVFESRGYDKPWDGRLNGQPLPAATYYYLIRLDDKESPLTGNVTIIK